ncbi:hypothetical protein TRFO_04413 [Tritrichomonas foetus]|uniref:Exportin-1/Importin-beta-like domain-containing protein n=1 Tax=Tritrichomonas foetus TaxID=1144522 RepID=A0A1J4KKI7_9EUKA|nr:hypothetical protein TRFO_04413 [Tritrichomonas foetus]|eukprot:OHT09877.1 hypothetical protein TRFO_04413 [Tritrichomonas foetus]
MEISKPVLEAAANSMINGSIEQQQDAVNFFSAWQNTNGVLIDAVRILADPEISENLRFFISCVVLYSIDSWFRYERSALDEIKNIIFHLTFQPNEEISLNHAQNLSNSNVHLAMKKIDNNRIKDKLDQIIAKILFNEWPENWADFLPQLKQFLTMKNESHTIHVFMILSYFLKLLDNSTKITLKRRIVVTSYFMQQIPDVLSIVLENLFSPGIIHSFLEFSEAFCAVIGHNPEMAINFSSFLFTNFAVIDDYAEQALKSIAILFSPNIFLAHLIQPMVSLIVQRESSNISMESSFHQFSCLFLKNFMKIIIPYITENNSPTEILNNQENFSNTNNLSNLQKIFQTSLVLAPRDEFCESFWNLWNEVLEVFVSSNSPQFQQLISPLLPLVVTTFYELLPCSSQLSRLISPLTASSFKSLMKIIPQETLSFIMNQPPNLSLCFAVGLARNNELFPKLGQIIESSINSTDLNVISAVLYSISRNTCLLQSQELLIQALQQLTFTFLYQNSDSDFHATVLFALNHVASAVPDVITRNKQFIDLLFDCASPIKLNKDNFSRLCRILAKVILSTPPQAKSEYIERLTNIATIPLMSGDLHLIIVGAQAAWSISSISILGSYIISKQLWAPLLNAMKYIRESAQSSQLSTNSAEQLSSQFSDLISVFASSVRSAPFSLCRKVIDKFIHLVSTVTGHDTVILDAFNMMYQIHRGLDDYRDNFAQIFVQRMAGNPQQSFFEFFTIAGLKDHEENVVVGGACASLPNPDILISKSATYLLREIISRKKDPQFLIHWQPHIIRAVFASLFDELHKEMIVHLIKVLFSIYKKHIRNSTLNPFIDQLVVEAISESVGDADVSMHFAVSLRSFANSKNEFVQLIKDFLLAYGRLNPLEIKLFDESVTKETSCTVALIRAEIPGDSGSTIQNEDEYVTQYS